MTPQQQAKAQQKAEEKYPLSNDSPALNDFKLNAQMGLIAGIELVLNNPDEWGLVTDKDSEIERENRVLESQLIIANEGIERID